VKDVLVNEPAEIKELMAWKPEAEIALKRLNRQDPYYQRLEDIIKSVPTAKQYAEIEALPDADKQIVLTAISQLFDPVEPDPIKWRKVNAIKSNTNFAIELMPLFNGMTMQDIRELNHVYQTLEFNRLQDATQKVKTPKKGRDLLEATLLEMNEAPTGVKAEASVISIPNYIPPDSFRNMSKNNQDEYIKLLGKLLTEPMKKEVFGRKQNGRQISISNYTISGAKSGERDVFYKNLVKNDSSIKTQLETSTGLVGSGLVKRGRKPSGKGIASTCKEQTPRWIEMGRFRINGRLLDEKQPHSVRYQSGTATPLFPKMVPISDAFHELLTNLFEFKKLDKRLLKELDPEERRSAETLLVKSGVGRGLGLKEISPTDEEARKIKRFDVVRGSYLAGNNSLAVIHELRSLIIHFVTTGKLSRKEGLRSLVELQ
jgi:hypothetical protein